MAKGRELKRRIKTVENTRKITRTMELVATSRMKRAQDRVAAARPYARALGDVIAGLYSPAPVEQQIMIIYAVTNGFLDDVAVKDLKAWERGFHDFMGTKFPQVGNAIRGERAISKESEAALRRGIEEYKKVAQK